MADQPADNKDGPKPLELTVLIDELPRSIEFPATNPKNKVVVRLVKRRFGFSG
jgi:hypothetical protein